jgi:hypothetical protein
MATVQAPEQIQAQETAPSAVVWIDERNAIVVALTGDACLSTCEIDRGSLQESAYLAQVVRVIGDRQRVAILGPSSVRLALEREYVALFQRPDRLVDVEPAGPVSAGELVDRVRLLAA